MEKAGRFAARRRERAWLKELIENTMAD